MRGVVLEERQCRGELQETHSGELVAAGETHEGFRGVKRTDGAEEVPAARAVKDVAAGGLHVVFDARFSQR